ncbi:MAG: hypothetical protein FVQ83_06880 [Chloroflexi bacterium]|nr:hypothetical protein [Chloroflexota bacterium]
MTELTAEKVVKILVEKTLGLDVILKDIELSEEKFMRIVSLLRKIGRFGDGFESEWSFTKIKKQINKNLEFANMIAELLLDGYKDTELQEYIPRYYLDNLNYREIGSSPIVARRIRYKRSLIGTYGGKKGYYVEGKIEKKLVEIGTPYGKGRSKIIETDIDFAIPNTDDPWIVIMSTFQETTSSGQTNKTRDMLSAFERINRHNSRYNEKRVFVNFVDGGGWLARKRDMERLVNQCHYYVNLKSLDMLEAIVKKHIRQSK